MELYINTTADEDINPAEEEALRRFVARTTVGCPMTAIQTAVSTADMVLGQDWTQEAKKVMREFGLPVNAAPAPMYANA